jgi:hypothetical protein
MPRTRIGDHRNRFLLFAANTTLGWCRVKDLSFDDGEKLVREGKVRRVVSEVTLVHIGYQLLPPSQQYVDKDVPSLTSSASISMREMQLNVERSRTEGLPEPERLLLHVPEDQVERVQAKVLVFPHVGSAPGDVLRAWPREKSLADLRRTLAPA